MGETPGRDLPVRRVDLAGQGGYRWQVWVYGDGTARLVRRRPDRTIVGAVSRRPGADLRAEIVQLGIPDVLWTD
jgi:hypothetical protein